MPAAKDPPTPDKREASQDAIREQSASDFMGPGFIGEISKQPVKRRAYEFWYHPYTELAIFGLIIASVAMLIGEVALANNSPIGWIGGIAGGTTEGWFFWVDLGITLFFVVEFASKLWITPAGRKWFFIRQSWVELIALLPMLRVFRLFRIFRAARLFRFIRILRSLRLARTTTTLGRFLKSFGAELDQNSTTNLIVLVYLVSSIIFGTTGVMIFENGADSGFDTFGDALWWCVVTLSTVGYGDMVPVTAGGRIVATAVVFAGLGLWSLVTGVLATTLINRSARRATMGIDILGIQDHIVVLGWNANGHRLIRDLRPLAPTRHLVVVTEKDDLGLPLDALLHHLRKDPAADDAIDHSQVAQARAVLILADDTGCCDDSDVDARTVMICMNLRQLSPGLRIVAEICEGSNLPLARRAGADEAIVTHNYTGALLSQALQSPGVTRAFAQLFDIGEGSLFSEIDVPSALHGLCLSQASKEIYRTEQLGLVGIHRRDQLIIDPDDDPTLNADDKLIIIANRNPLS